MSEVVIFTVGRTAGPGARAEVVARVPNAEQAFEAVRQLVEDQLAHAGGPDELGALEESLRDLDEEGPQPYGWWGEAGGREIWYAPEAARAPEGFDAGEVALLASLRDLPGLSSR